MCLRINSCSSGVFFDCQILKWFAFSSSLQSYPLSSNALVEGWKIASQSSWGNKQTILSMDKWIQLVILLPMKNLSPKCLSSFLSILRRKSEKALWIFINDSLLITDQWTVYANTLCKLLTLTTTWGYIWILTIPWEAEVWTFGLLIFNHSRITHIKR